MIEMMGGKNENGRVALKCIHSHSSACRSYCNVLEGSITVSYVGGEVKCQILTGHKFRGNYRMVSHRCCKIAQKYSKAACN